MASPEGQEFKSTEGQKSGGGRVARTSIVISEELKHLYDIAHNNGFDVLGSGGFASLVRKGKPDIGWPGVGNTREEAVRDALRGWMDSLGLLSGTLEVDDFGIIPSSEDLVAIIE